MTRLPDQDYHTTIARYLLDGLSTDSLPTDLPTTQIGDLVDRETLVGGVSICIEGRCTKHASVRESLKSINYSLTEYCSLSSIIGTGRGFRLRERYLNSLNENIHGIVGW